VADITSNLSAYWPLN
jgi:hypothetical protein